MAKNNFDDFLLDPSFNDLDDIHLEAERQLFKKGGMKYSGGGKRLPNPNSKPTINAPKRAEVKVKKEMKRVDPKKTKRGTGVTYRAAWDANRGGVQSKYKTFAEFKAAAQAWNKKQDAKKAKANKPKPSTTPNATQKKKLTSKSMYDKIPQGRKI